MKREIGRNAYTSLIYIDKASFLFLLRIFFCNQIVLGTESKIINYIYINCLFRNYLLIICVY